MLGGGGENLREVQIDTPLTLENRRKKMTLSQGGGGAGGVTFPNWENH